MKGKGFLKVTGILMIIGGALGAILGLIATLGGGATAAALGIKAGPIIVAGIISLVSGIIELIAGIVGVKNCANPAAATKCIVFGIIVAVLSIVGTIITAAGGGKFPIGSLLLGLVIPVLYIIGAALNKKSAAAPADPAAPVE